MNKLDAKLEYNILNEISKNNIPKGASTLALLVNVSQATIGRKLQELEHKRVLEKHSNKGRILTSEGKEYFRKLQNYCLKTEKIQELINETDDFSKQKLLDILYARKILERETAMLTTKNINAAQIKQLEQILNIQEIKVAQDFLGDEEDLKFHSLLAHISGNQVLEQILVLILTQKRVYTDFSYIRKLLPSTVVSDHKKILQAIKSGDAESAGKAMVSHIERIIIDVNKYFKKEGDEK